MMCCESSDSLQSGKSPPLASVRHLLMLHAGGINPLPPAILDFSVRDLPQQHEF